MNESPRWIACPASVTLAEPWIIWSCEYDSQNGYWTFRNASTGRVTFRKASEYRGKDARTLVEYLNTRGG
jgi:hypothetical protein